ncbi:hypothetical protein R1flu_011071 [Riccia fluitans]|uniref:Uncharacterized protein n=1 Tax=Riccia fluitans TaxID=41844 RepID=A0ABD1Z6T2_9MARC
MEFIERGVAYHMGELQRGFSSGVLDENLIENMDNMHFMINMDNGKTLGFRGNEEVKYADVISGGVGMTMVVKITGGPNAKIGVPFMIFKNKDETHPIRRVPDDRTDVCYRTTKKVNDKEFPANATHLVQPADSFVISKIKDAWSRQWEEKKMEKIAAGMWQGNGVTGSGALQNPQKPYFLKLAAAVVKDVNNQITKKTCPTDPDMNYDRKAMIRYGLSKNITGVWKEQQLSPELQNIVK